MSNTNEKTLVGKDISYEQWLRYMKNKPAGILFEDYMFPTEEIRNLYIKNIHDFAEDDVQRVLAKFINLDGILGADKYLIDILRDAINNDKAKAAELINHSSHYKKLFLYLKTNGRAKVYDSILWALDLLPDNPRDTLNVISAYLTAHIVHLPDGRINGLSDAEDIVRARYFDAEVDKSVLYSLTPTDFEHVVEGLYDAMGYTTKMTKKSYDGGRDIIAGKTDTGKKEHLVISCKRVKGTVSATDYREIMFAVDAERATKGVVVATAKFSSVAKKSAADSPRLELIDQTSLHRLMNEHIGASWYARVSSIIRDSKERHPDDSRI